MEALKAEFEKVKSQNFSLRFVYPTEEERKSMMTVNRDMSKAEQDRSTKRRSNFAEMIESLESGESYLEDYPEDLLKKLEVLMAAKKKPKGRRK
jgi:superfamily I DNA and RNA helicase